MENKVNCPNCGQKKDSGGKCPICSSDMGSIGSCKHCGGQLKWKRTSKSAIVRPYGGSTVLPQETEYECAVCGATTKSGGKP